jgi:predicted RNA-binding protein with RPS1 domain
MVSTDLEPAVALEPKTRLTGRVIKTTLAGALVELGQPLPGVLHISQLQKDPVNKVEDVVREGQAVEVWVRKVRKDRIELTMIKPLQFEWNDLQADMVVTGKVVRLESYGAFVEIGAERPGMIHISELARGYVKQASDVVKEGDEVEAKILSVDAHKRQIRLSLKALQPEVPVPEKPPREPKRTKGAAQAQRDDPTPGQADPTAAQLTSMEIAWQTAQERAKSKGKTSRTKRARRDTSEQEEILNRTLEKRVVTGA